MDIGTLVGKTYYDFIDKEGRPVQGYRFHFTMSAPLNDPNFKGVQAVSFTASAALYNQWRQLDCFIPDLDDMCVIRYNRYGRLDHFDAVP